MGPCLESSVQSQGALSCSIISHADRGVTCIPSTKNRRKQNLSFMWKALLENFCTSLNLPVNQNLFSYPAKSQQTSFPSNSAYSVHLLGFIPLFSPPVLLHSGWQILSSCSFHQMEQPFCDWLSWAYFISGLMPPFPTKKIKNPKPIKLLFLNIFCIPPWKYLKKQDVAAITLTSGLDQAWDPLWQRVFVFVLINVAHRDMFPDVSGNGIYNPSDWILEQGLRMGDESWAESVYSKANCAPLCCPEIVPYRWPVTSFTVFSPD